MPHTRLMRQVRRALTQARLALPGEANAIQQRALSRRAALMLLAGTAAAACSPRADNAPPAGADRSPVTIIGGGTSGLVTAWRLASAGVPVTVYESSSRTGGRMYTLRDFTPEGHFCELGGELVDSNHTRLMSLCGELGIEIQRLRPENDPASDAFDFGGKIYTVADLLDPAAQTGAFIPAAARIAADQAALLDADDNWTARALELDALPLSQYLNSLRDTTDAWVVDLLGVAYLGEFGVPLDQQSALNLVDYVAADPSQPFSMFGESDEANRIAGGSGTLPERLTQELTQGAAAASASINLRHELAGITRENGEYRLSFRTPDGDKTATTTRIVLALPFTRLRSVEGLGGLGLSADKMRAINELGYGSNSKLMVATSSRPWTKGSLFGQNAPLTGTVYTDKPFQLVWETSVGQPGEGGVLTNFLAADAAMSEETAAVERLLSGLRALSPALADTVRPDLKASFFWPRHPHTLGSYSAARTGQYTQLFEHAASSAFDGTMVFAGEHTSVDGYGFMNGAVDAGERAAAELLGEA